MSVQMLSADRARASAGAAPGFLIVNADDWGRDVRTTDMIFDCVNRGAVSSVSAMVFMEDSERAAGMARAHGVDSGLHLNFTAPFTGAGCPGEVAAHQRRLTAHLRRHRLAQTVFHPGLVRSFEYVVAAQLEEYRRLYGTEPRRLDGHHHMHLCANMLFQRLLPAGTLVRRNFSFQSGEKGAHNRLYRRWVDAALARRHQLTDYLFNMVPLDDTERLRRIAALARTAIVELETHPVAPDEYRFLHGGEIFRLIGETTIAPASRLHERRTTRGHQ